MLCPCGCQREVLSKRATYARCRLKVSQQNRAPAPATVRSTRILKDGTAERECRHQWELDHGPGSWDANPWVWAVSFRRAET